MHPGGNPWSCDDVTATAGAPPAQPHTLTSWFSPTDNMQHIAFVDANGRVQELYMHPGGPAWTFDNVTATAGAPAVQPQALTSWFSPTDNMQHIAAVDINGHVQELYMHPGGAPWTFDDVTGTAGAPAVQPQALTSWFSPTDSIRHIAAIDGHGHVQELYMHPAGAPWAWDDATKTAGAPAAQPQALTSWFSPADTMQHIAFIDSHGHVQELYMHPGGAPWTFDDVTATAGAPAAKAQALTSWFSPADAMQHIAVIDSQSHVQELYMHPGGAPWTWDDPSGMASAPNAQGQALTTWFSPTDKMRHIAYVDSNGHVQELYKHPGPEPWSYDDATATANNPRFSYVQMDPSQLPALDPCAPVVNPNSPTGLLTFDYHVAPSKFLRNYKIDFTTPEEDDGRLIDFLREQAEWGDPHVILANAVALLLGSGPTDAPRTSWSFDDVTATAAAPAAQNRGALTSWYSPADDMQHIAFVDGDGHVRELYMHPGGAPWSSDDVTATAGAPTAQPETLTSWYSPTDDMQHIAFIDEDGHVRELYMHPGGAPWSCDDVTATAGAPAAQPQALTSWYSPSDNMQHIAFVDNNWHVEELYMHPAGAPWSGDDVTFTAAAPAAQPEVLTSWFSPSDDLQHIAFIGPNGPVEELYMHPGGEVDPDVITAVAQLAVTGRGVFTQFSAWTPQDTDLVSATQKMYKNVSFDPAALEAAAHSVLDIAYRTLWAIRSNDPAWRAFRPTLGWIATSGIDDTPHRPVNVPTGPYPQFDVPLVLPGAYQSINVTTRLMVAQAQEFIGPNDSSVSSFTHPEPSILDPAGPGSGPSPDGPAPRSIPPGQISIDPESEIIIYIHGGGSRAEEAVNLASWLIVEGAALGHNYTVISFDLPNSAYATPFDIEEVVGDIVSTSVPVIGGWSSYHPSQGDVLKFEEQYIVTFLETLDQVVGNVTSRIAAIMGGSLGGNMSLRLSSENNPDRPYLSRAVVAWSATCVAPSSNLPILSNGFVSSYIGGLLQSVSNPEQDSTEASWLHDVYYKPLSPVSVTIDMPFGLNPIDVPYIPAQPIMWYRAPDWQPCKAALICQTRFDRYEIYRPSMRHWACAIDLEQVYYSFQDSYRYLSIAAAPTCRLLLASGDRDNYNPNAIYNNTGVVASLINSSAQGRAEFWLDTGHSFHDERPHLFAREIAAFLNDPSAPSSMGTLLTTPPRAGYSRTDQ
jgi:hypothetical protein